MGDEGMNACECIFNYDAVTRLLTLLRESQAHCTDNECLNLSNLPGPQNESSMGDWFVIGIAFLVMALLYVSRPNSLRSGFGEKTKDRKGPSGSNDPPAPPPPSIN